MYTSTYSQDSDTIRKLEELLKPKSQNKLNYTKKKSTNED